MSALEKGKEVLGWGAGEVVKDCSLRRIHLRGDL